jgi:hypothetical protein
MHHVFVLKKPADLAFRLYLDRVLRFPAETPGSTVPVSWYALKVSGAYHVMDPGVLMLVVLSEDGVMRGARPVRGRGSAREKSGVGVPSQIGSGYSR